MRLRNALLRDIADLLNNPIAAIIAVVIFAVIVL